MALIAQEVSTERYIEIPQTIRELYALWRPAPLVRALRFERALGTGARIYYKYEGGSPAGSHKPNTAVAQAYYNKLEGTTKLTTETGAGQWGASLSFAGALLGLEVEVWQVRASYDSKPYRKAQMEVYGDVAGLTPLLKMHTLGKDFVPPSIHAGGLRYHGMSPMVSHAVNLGLMDAIAIEQDAAFEAGLLFARSEGIIPAPESTHAVAGAIAHARQAADGEVIVLGLSGNGVLDLPAYAQYV